MRKKNNRYNKALEPAPERIAALCGSFYGGAVQLKRYESSQDLLHPEAKDTNSLVPGTFHYGN